MEIFSLHSFDACSSGKFLHVLIWKCLDLNFLIMAYLYGAKESVAHISFPVLVAHAILNMCPCESTVRVYLNFLLKS